MPSILTSGDKIVNVYGRSTSLARPSQPFNASYGGGAIGLLGDFTVSFQRLYETQPWVRVCADKLARQIATLPLKVYEKGSQNQRDRVTEGLLVDAIRRPWFRAGPVDLKAKLAWPALVHGNGLVYKRRDRPAGPPVGFRPLDWRFIQWDAAGSEIIGWSTTELGGREPVRREDVLHVHWEAGCPVGRSPLEALGVTLRLEDAAQRFTTSSFGRRVTPNIAVSLDKDATYNDETRRGIREELAGLFGGVEQAGGVAVFGGGASVETLSHTAQEAELIEQRKLNREEVAAVYDVPPPMVGILDKATYANINEQHRMLYTTILRPWLTLIEERFEAQVIDGEVEFEGQYVEFDMGEVLKGDAKARADAYKQFITAGVYTINEVRALENLPPINHPLADRPLIPSNNNTPVGDPPAGPDSGAGQAARALATRLADARHRALSNAGRGHSLFDGDRFELELADDVGDTFNGTAAVFATVWRQAVEAAVADAGPNPDRLEQAFAALGAAN